MKTHRPPPDLISRAMVVCACLLQFTVATAAAFTRLPLCDEGFYGVPAHVLSVTGALRNPVMESAGVDYLRGIEQSVYWMAPLGMVLQAAAFNVLGFGLMVQRELSVLCGMGAVLLWYLALRRLVADRVAALGALLLSLDFIFISLSSLGRSDMISLFFTMAAMTAYLFFRERSLALALTVAPAACALSGTVHPNGGVAAVVVVAVLCLTLDRRQLRLRHIGIAAASLVVVLGLGWGLYIAKSPDLFEAQFLGNVERRLIRQSTGVARYVTGEISRYMAAYGVDDVRGPQQVRALLPLSYLAAIAICLFSRELRRRARVLLVMFAGLSLSLVFLEGTKQGWYLVHVTPLFGALLAMAVTWLWTSGRVLLRVLAVAQVGIALLSIASHGYSVSQMRLQRLYRPTVAFLNTHVGPQDLVFARSEFYFEMECRACLRDDERLGAFSGRRADYIVIDPDYIAQQAEFREAHPDKYAEIEQILRAEYREVFRNSTYKVFRRTSASALTAGSARKRY